MFDEPVEARICRLVLAEGAPFGRLQQFELDDTRTGPEYLDTGVRIVAGVLTEFDCFLPDTRT